MADFVLLIIRIPICQVLCVRMHQREQYGRQNNSDHRFEPWLSTCEKVHVTFSTPTFCTRFVNAKSLAINKKSYFILSAHRPVTFVGVFDAPFELADETIVKRLEDFYECQVVDSIIIAMREQVFPTEYETFSVILNRHLLLPNDLGVFKFVCFTKISRRGAIYVIAVGIWRLDALILSVLIVIY